MSSAAVEAIVKKKNVSNVRNRIKKLVLIAMLSAIAVVLMMLEFPMPLSPSFVRMDFSELPVMMGGFIAGPGCGTAIAAIKILITLFLHGTTAMGIGELASLAGSMSYVLPAALYYQKGKRKKKGGQALLLGTLAAGVAMTAVNAFVIFPLYVRLFGMTVGQLVNMGTIVNPLITDIQI